MDTLVSSKKTEFVAIVGLLLHFFFACLLFLLSYWSRSVVVLIEAWHFLAGFFLWFLVLLHAQQKRLALEESLFEQQAKESQKTIFQEDETDTFSAKNRLQFFEKWIVPTATLLLGLGLIALSIWTMSRALAHTRPIVHGSLCAAFLGGCAFFSLLVSKYALGMSKEKDWRILRAGGSYLLMNASATFACAIVLALVEMEIISLERYLAYALSVLLGLIGLEMLLNLLLDFYRPRIPGQEIHPPYDSRFLEICTGSKGLLKTAAQTLDYQFGFKVSETWFYRFLEKAIVPLVLFQLLTLYLANCLVVVQPSEQAILERFGKRVEHTVLEPGIHWKWPWPIEQIVCSQRH